MASPQTVVSGSVWRVKDILRFFFSGAERSPTGSVEESVLNRLRLAVPFSD